MPHSRTKQLTTIAMMSAMSCILMFIPGIPLMPAAPFLKYDFTDVVIVIGGFMFGPGAAFLIAVVTGFVNMVTVSSSGPWGMAMYVTSSAAFAVTAATVYKFKRTLPGAVVGLAAGIIVVVPVMLLWNYLFVPFYTTMPRERVVPMLVPVFLPFNAIKYSLSAGLVLLVYKPIVNALSAAGLFRADSGSSKGKLNWGVMAAAAVVVLALAATITVMRVLS
jgi:riboflavin transporter FmnP